MRRTPDRWRPTGVRGSSVVCGAPVLAVLWCHDGLMDLELSGRTYLITGASSGLGLASATVLAGEGANLVIASRDRSRIEATAAQIGPHVVPVAADLADPGSAANLLRAATESFGGCHGAVISVGGPPPGPAMQTTDEDWRQAFETVFLGAVRLARAALSAAPRHSGAAVTFVLSSSVKSPIGGLAISNGLRPGLAMLAKTLADEVGPDGARVNALLPGRIATDRVAQLDAATGDADAARARSQATIPLRRYGEPEEFGRVAAFLTSPAASYVSGAAWAVDGGMMRAL